LLTVDIKSSSRWKRDNHQKNTTGPIMPLEDKVRKDRRRRGRGRLGNVLNGSDDQELEKDVKRVDELPQPKLYFHRGLK